MLSRRTQRRRRNQKGRKPKINDRSQTRRRENYVTTSINSGNRPINWNNFPTSIVRFPGVIVPDRFQTKLIYTDNYHTLNGAALNRYQWRGNSVFDPDFTSTGHQPMGFDQFVNFYNSYRVRKSKVTLSLVKTTESVRLALLPCNLNSVPTSYETAVEEPYCRVVPISSSVANFTCSTSMNTSRMYGVSENAVTTNDDFGALVSNNPVNIWYWTLISTSYDGTTVANLWLDVTIEYDVEFYERVPLSQSLNKKGSHLSQAQLEEKIRGRLIPSVTEGSDLSKIKHEWT